MLVLPMFRSIVPKRIINNAKGLLLAFLAVLAFAQIAPKMTRIMSWQEEMTGRAILVPPNDIAHDGGDRTGEVVPRRLSNFGDQSHKAAFTHRDQFITEKLVLLPMLDIPYDRHDRTKLDFWRANEEGPRPLVVFIHGGGWIVGGKEFVYDGEDLEHYLTRGISCATVNYRRLTREANSLPAPVYDVARAIQFLRYHASEWNINKNKIVLVGSSAGAAAAMYLLYHDDLANPNSPDPVARESTRVRGVWSRNGQTSIDPKQIETWIGPNVLKSRMIFNAVGEDDAKQALDNYDEHAWLYREFSAYNHVRKGNPPLFMTYLVSDLTYPCTEELHCLHHPNFGLKMKEKCDEVGTECHLLIKGVSESERYSYGAEFVLTMLNSRNPYASRID